jgi:hypothetical protein
MKKFSFNSPDPGAFRNQVVYLHAFDFETYWFVNWDQNYYIKKPYGLFNGTKTYKIGCL